MGVRLGWALSFVVLLATEITIALLVDANNTACNSYCSQQSSNHARFMCKGLPDQGCNQLGKISSSEVTPVARPLVYIAGITVASSPNSSRYVLGVSWRSPSTEAWSITGGFGVRWNSYQSGVALRPQSKCQLYKVPKFSQLVNVTEMPSFYWCGSSLAEVHKHSITITALPSNNSLSLNITLPSNISLITDVNSGADWRTPVGVAVDVRWRSVAVVIQGAPAAFNITSYRLKLVNSENGKIYMEHILNANETSFVFENQTRHNGSVVSAIQVEPLGPGCQPRCHMSLSANFKLPSKPTALPSAPRTVPATTTTTVLPPSEEASVTLPTSTRPRSTVATGRGSHPSQSPDPSVIMQPATDKSEQSRKIIAGTVCGAVGLAVIVGVLFCVYRRSRNVRTGSFQMQRFGDRRDSDTSVMMDDPAKNMPIVLLLYSYDCPAHEVVVTTFAYYLKEVANCEVILDIWDQHNLQEQGSYAWLADKVDVAQFIVMISSTGARFKCARNRQVRMKHDRTLPDVFAWGVDHVAEKIRTAQTDSDSKSRYITVYFDYAGKSDIPPKLEVTKRFCLMKDIYSLYCHLHRLKQDGGNNGPPPKCGVTYETFTKTEEGRQLNDSLIDAKHFFRDNPNWLGQTLEAVTPVLSSSGRDANPEAPQLHPRMHPASPHGGGSDKDSFLEERKKKRIREMEGTMERIPLTKPSKEELVAPPYSTPGTSPSHVTSDGSSSVTSMSPLMTQTPRQVPNQGTGPTYANSNGTLQSRELDLDDDTDVDDSEMQRDIDFIQNFDANTWDTHNGSAGHFFVDVDLEMGVYTPPEDFLSLASLEEDATRALSVSNPASPAHRVNDSGTTRSPSTQGSPYRSSRSPVTNSCMNGSPAVSPSPFKVASPARVGSPPTPSSPQDTSSQGSSNYSNSPQKSGSPAGINSPVMYASPARLNSAPVSTSSSRTGSPSKRAGPRQALSAQPTTPHSPVQLVGSVPSSPLMRDSPVSVGIPATPAGLSWSTPSSPYGGTPKGSPVQPSGGSDQSLPGNSRFVIDFSGVSAASNGTDAIETTAKTVHL